MMLDAFKQFLSKEKHLKRIFPKLVGHREKQEGHREKQEGEKQEGQVLKYQFSSSHLCLITLLTVV